MEAMTVPPVAPQPSFSAEPPISYRRAPVGLDFAPGSPSGRPRRRHGRPAAARGPGSAVRLPQIRPAVALPLRAARPAPARLRPAVHAAYLADVEGISPRRLAASGVFDFAHRAAARASTSATAG